MEYNLPDSVIQEGLELLKIQEDREKEALRCYEPLPYQEEYHKCNAKEAIVVKGNQTGGSLCGFAEVARAVTGQDPYNKYPKKNGIAACIGYGQPHIGRVIHRYLFEPGQFLIIKDLITEKWRTYRGWPSDEERNGKYGDLDRKEEAEPAGAFIPQRFYDPGDFVWEVKGERVFKKVTLRTGWVIYAENSVGDPRQCQGFPADLVHFDEDVKTPGWYDEMAGRCMMREGKLRWTALPHSETDEIFNLIQRCEAEETSEEPESVQIKATIYDNPYIPKKTLELNEKIWKSAGEDVFKARALGKLTNDTVAAYPDFDKRTHNAIRHLDKAEQADEDEGVEVRTQLQRILTQSNGIPPRDWCRYLAFDPGHTIAAVVFLAVPPPSLSDQIVAYDELYIHRCTDQKWGRLMQQKCQDQCIQSFLIDAHGGRLTEQATGQSPRRKYEAQLRQRGIESVAYGPRFIDGVDEIVVREMALRDWLKYDEDLGHPKLMIVQQRCPNLVKELSNLKKKTRMINGTKIVSDKINRDMACHAVECLEYLAAHHCFYVKPETEAVEGRVSDRIRRLQKSRNLTGGQQIIHLGPQGSRNNASDYD